LDVVGCFLVERIGIACERIGNPALWGAQLALIGADNVVRTVSTEAEGVGVRPGQPLSAARLLCPSLIYRPYDREAYFRAAEVVWNAVAAETSFVEPVSPELCFFDLHGSEQEKRIAALIRSIRPAVGVEVRVGIATGRFVAEMAARDAEDTVPNIVPIGMELSATASCRLDTLSDLDPATVERLRKLGVVTVGDLIDMGVDRLPKALRSVATVLIRRCQGLDSSPVLPLWPPRVETARITFDDEVGDYTRLEEAARFVAAQIANRLRTSNRCARQMTLTLEFADGTSQIEAEQVAKPVSGEKELARAALRLLKRLSPTRPVILVMLEAQQIAPASDVQLSLLDSNPGCGYLPHEREERLSKGIQFLSRRFGIASVIPLQKLHTVTKVGLRTYALGHIADQPVDVAVGQDGDPERVYRDRETTRVEAVHQVWDESVWEWGELHQHSVYRVLTEHGDLWELHQYGKSWRLRSLVD
jgi:DNA polymerase-4